jgi:hypothetical protein
VPMSSKPVRACAVQQLPSSIATWPLMIAPTPMEADGVCPSGRPGAVKARRQRPPAEPALHRARPRSDFLNTTGWLACAAASHTTPAPPGGGLHHHRSLWRRTPSHRGSRSPIAVILGWNGRRTAVPSHLSPRCSGMPLIEPGSGHPAGDDAERSGTLPRHLRGHFAQRRVQREPPILAPTSQTAPPRTLAWVARRAVGSRRLSLHNGRNDVVVPPELEDQVVEVGRRYGTQDRQLC